MTSIYKLLRNPAIDRRENRSILRHIVDFTEAQLISHADYCLTNTQLDEYNQHVARIINGEPLAYILGYKEFYSRVFKLSPATLIPRPETELLVDQVISLAKASARILDLGTGSGCIAITLKLQRPDLQIIASDKSVAALDIAKLNAENLAANITFVCSDWFNLIANQRFDIIVSNPPYIANNDPHLAQLQFEPQQALTDFRDGLTHIRQITAQASNFLVIGGYLIIEHGFDQGEAVRDIFTKNKFNEIVTIRDLANLERFTRGQWLGMI